MTDSGWVEASGDTVDDAIDAVLDILDLDEEDTEIEVVAEPPGGPVRVRARPAPGVEDEEILVEEEEASDEEKVEVARAFCEGVLDSFELDGEVDAWVDDDGVLRVELSGDDLGVLIGRRGKTLQALAELVRTVVLRQTGARTRLFVDVEGYRARRREALASYAVRLAERVARSGVEYALEPMPAGDRKVVHDAVNAIPGAVTFSEGEEPRRYVVISPGPDASAASERATRRARA